ncbi:MAG TPA: ABC transporter permease subunit [Bradyrhizobium sp.]|nr:ABC transporter permease subunit [Bradyrhizobium sp.]
MARFLSLAFVIVLWTVIAAAAHSPLLPGPAAVADALLRDTRSLALPYHLACTLLRVAAAFVIAFLLGMAAGFAMGKSSLVDRIGDPWLVILLNLPALVTIILAYIWVGLNETAAIAAVALNKFPNVVVLTREGTRALSAELEDVAHVFRLSWPARIRHIVLPQLAPYLAAAFRTGISIIWKIVLVVELIGRPNGVGFVLGSAFSLFDMVTIFAYSIAFIAIMLVIESLIVQPLERNASRWRRKVA